MSAEEVIEHRTEHSPASLADARTDRRKFLIPDSQVPKILDALRRGSSEVSIARALGVNYRTWMRVRVEDERVASALAESRKVEEDELVTILIDKAREGDTTALIFALKGRHGYRDHGTPQGGEEARVNVTINLPAAQPSMGDYMKTVQGRVL